MRKPACYLPMRMETVWKQEIPKLLLQSVTISIFLKNPRSLIYFLTEYLYRNCNHHISEKFTCYCAWLLWVSSALLLYRHQIPCQLEKYHCSMYYVYGYEHDECLLRNFRRMQNATKVRIIIWMAN